MSKLFTVSFLPKPRSNFKVDLALKAVARGVQVVTPLLGAKNLNIFKHLECLLFIFFTTCSQKFTHQFWWGGEQEAGRANHGLTSLFFAGVNFTTVCNSH